MDEATLRKAIEDAIAESYRESYEWNGDDSKLVIEFDMQAAVENTTKAVKVLWNETIEAARAAIA